MFVVGRIVFQLFSDICPKTCKNFLSLCTGEFFFSILHRENVCKWSVNHLTHDRELVYLQWSLVLKQALCFYVFNYTLSVVRMKHVRSMAYFGDVLRKSKMSVILDFPTLRIIHDPSTDGCKSVNRLQINPPSHFHPTHGLAGTRCWHRQRWEMAAQLFPVNTYTLHSHMQQSGCSFLTHWCGTGSADTIQT